MHKVFIVSLVLGLTTACHPSEEEGALIAHQGALAEQAPLVELLRSDEHGAEFLINVPELRGERLETESGRFIRLQSPGRDIQHLRLGGDAHVSQPETLVANVHLALPLGAGLGDIRITPEGGSQRVRGRLYPVQPPVTSAEEDIGKVLPFVFRAASWRSARTDVRRLRDVRAAHDSGAGRIHRLRLDLVDYDPAQRALVRHERLRIRVDFVGGDRCYRRSALGDERLDAVDALIEAQPRAFASVALNFDDLLRWPCPWPGPFNVLGARFVIVTHPDFRAAADTLATHKRGRGISTVIFETDDIAADAGVSVADLTDEHIRDHVIDFHDRVIIKPLWLLLIGDAEFIPTHYSELESDMARYAGDAYYGQFGGDPLSIPTLGIGRFPVDTLAEAEVIVEKTMNFENAPPAFLSGFYRDMTFAAEFQDDNDDGQANRAFTQTAERIRDFLLPLGYDIERIYKTKSSAAPALYSDGTALPPDLDPSSGFAWNGRKSDIIAAANAGTNILFHRDHGSKNGWSTPAFKVADVPSVSVPAHEYPIALSINCASGLFDNETVNDPEVLVGSGHPSDPNEAYWAEVFIRQADGALAIFGDTRASVTGANNLLAQGLFDALFPDYDTGFGPTDAILTLGDVLNHGKAYYADQTGQGDVGVEKQLTIYNLFGDPTLEARMRAPLLIRWPFVNWYPNRLRVPFQLEADCQDQCADPGPVVGVLREPLSGKVLARSVGERGVLDFAIGRVDTPVELTLSGRGLRTSKRVLRRR